MVCFADPVIPVFVCRLLPTRLILIFLPLIHGGRRVRDSEDKTSWFLIDIIERMLCLSFCSLLFIIYYSPLSHGGYITEPRSKSPPFILICQINHYHNDCTFFLSFLAVYTYDLDFRIHLYPPATNLLVSTRISLVIFFTVTLFFTLSLSSLTDLTHITCASLRTAADNPCPITMQFQQIYWLLGALTVPANAYFILSHPILETTRLDP